MIRQNVKHTGRAKNSKPSTTAIHRSKRSFSWENFPVCHLSLQRTPVSCARISWTQSSLMRSWKTISTTSPWTANPPTALTPAPPLTPAPSWQARAPVWMAAWWSWSWTRRRRWWSWTSAWRSSSWPQRLGVTLVLGWDFRCWTCISPLNQLSIVSPRCKCCEEKDKFCVGEFSIIQKLLTYQFLAKYDLLEV